MRFLRSVELAIKLNHRIYLFLSLSICVLFDLTASVYTPGPDMERIPG